MKPYRVEFEFTDKAMLHIVADNEEAAREGALKMVEKHVKNPVVTGVFEATEEILPVETPRTIN